MGLVSSIFANVGDERRKVVQSEEHEENESS